MANEKITDMAAMVTFSPDDLFECVDMDEAAAADRNKKLSKEVMFDSAPDFGNGFTMAAGTVLDTYEEGTWTITDGSGAGLALIGTFNIYTKIGRLVVATAVIEWPDNANGSGAKIALPFTAIVASSATGGVITQQDYDNNITLTASIDSTTGVVVRQRGATSLTNANLSGKKLRFTITYHAA